jgi:glycosyltransferase involved in cell wall biosynthesis
VDNQKIITIGHIPPPITGENLCRRQLEEVLVSAGFEVKPYDRAVTVDLLKTTASRVVILNRQSRLGTASDYILMCWFLLRRKQVWLYFHNRSWRRYARFPFATIARTFANGQLKMLVLTREIAAALREAGHDASVLNNSGGEVFDGMASWPSPRGKRRLLWMGRPDEAKGFPFALDVFKGLHDSDADWRFDVYGTKGDNLPKLPGVIYHGFVQGQEKIEAFAEGGIFILPSDYANETQPLSIIEALAAGLPVVASRVGGIPDMLVEGDKRAGIVLPSRRPDDYIKAVKMCLDHHSEFSPAAKEIYRRKYSYTIFRRVVAEEFSRRPTRALTSVQSPR